MGFALRPRLKGNTSYSAPYGAALSWLVSVATNYPGLYLLPGVGPIDLRQALAGDIYLSKVIGSQLKHAKKESGAGWGIRGEVLYLPIAIVSAFLCLRLQGSLRRPSSVANRTPLLEKAMQHHTVIIVGGGQAGLSISYCLKDRGVDHVVFEQNRVGHAWRHQRWDSFCLVTPNWQCQLPGFPYSGDDPNGFMARDAIC
jgi:hypothetical protein